MSKVREREERKGLREGGNQRENGAEVSMVREKKAQGAMSDLRDLSEQKKGTMSLCSS